MPVPMFMAKVNKRVFNPMEIKKGKRPVLSHIGRSTGTEYHTPLEAYQIDGGFIMVVMYGPKTEWLRNILEAGSARLKFADKTYDLTEPQLINEEAAFGLLPDGTKPPPKFLKVSQYLQMEVVE